MTMLSSMPSLSDRPGFPSGLKVLLLDPDTHARVKVAEQLQQCSYSVVQCSSSSEAAAHLATAEHAYDVLLVDRKALVESTTEAAALLAAAKVLPLVIMSDSNDPNEVMAGVNQGAVDYLLKPISMLKLRNLWQHTVRRLLAGGSPSPTAAAAAAAASVGMNSTGTMATTPPALPHEPQDSGSAGSQSAGGETGSHASSSERAVVKADADQEMDTSSLSQPMQVDRKLSVSNSLSHCMAPIPGLPRVPAMQQATNTAESMCQPLRNAVQRQLHCFTAQPPQPRASTNEGSGTSVGLGANACRPVLGVSAGQLPPTGGPGMVWGLPTTPLQVVPKLPGAWQSFMSPPAPARFGMPWPFPPAMMPAPMGVLGAPYSASQGPPATAAQGMASTLIPTPMSAMAAAAPAAPANSCSQVCKQAEPLMNWQLPEKVHSMPARMPDIMAGTEHGNFLKPPIGLQLKKSASFLDMVSQSLQQPVVPIVG